MRLSFFNGGANLNQGTRYKSSPILSELIGLEGSVEIFCDFKTEIPHFQQDGTEYSPFASIQSAVKYAESFAHVRGFQKLWTIRVKAGKYVERVVVRRPNISIVSDDMTLYNACPVTIAAPISDGMPALIFTNATPESLEKYLTTGLYSDLEPVEGESGPMNCKVDGVSCIYNTTYLPADMAFLGVKGDASPTTTWMGRELDFPNDVMAGICVANSKALSLRAKNSCSIFIDRFYGDLNVENVGKCDARMSKFGDVSAGYEVGHTDGEPATGHLYVGLNQCTISGDLILSGSVVCGSDRGMFLSRVLGSTVLTDTATLIGKIFEVSDLTVAGGATVDMKTSDVTGDMSLLSGVGVVSMKYGSKFFGELIDPDNRLQFGSPGERSFTKENGIAVTLINGTGAPTVKGTIADVSDTVDLAFNTSAISSLRVLGVVYDDGVADGELCRVVIGGVVDVLMEDLTVVSLGDWILPGAATVGRATVGAAAPGIWHPLETNAGGVDQLVRCFFKARPSL